MTDRERAIKYRKEARRYKRKYFELKRATEQAGHWIEDIPISNEFTKSWYYVCSLCGASYGTSCFNYCPNCGAKMEDNDGKTI